MTRLKRPFSVAANTHVHLFGRPTIAEPLRKVKLENILAGDTCTPIGLADFEAYLSFIERSIENLQFVVWYQSYRQRFFALPEAVRALSPGAALTQLSLANPETSILSSSIQSTTSTQYLSPMSSTTDTTEVYHDDPLRSPPQSPTLSKHLSMSTMSSSLRSTTRVRHTTHRSGTPATPFGAAPAIPRSQQPFRSECSRIVATFFKPGSGKELSLDEDIHQAVLSALALNTHPDVFIPAYDAIFDTLQTVSLPRFLAFATTVTNKPKQIFWYASGVAWFCLGVLIFALTMAFAPWGNFGSRAIRLLCAIPLGLGTSMMYTANQGFCLKIAGRQRVQLRPWELASADDHTHDWWAMITKVPDVSEDGYGDEALEKLDDVEGGSVEMTSSGSTSALFLPLRLASIAARRARMARNAMLVDVSAITHIAEVTGASRRRAPVPPVTISFTRTTTVAEEIDEDTPASDPVKDDSSIISVPLAIVVEDHDDEDTTATSQSQLNRASSPRTHSRHNSRNGFHSPPVFGPEKVVLDPRIASIHAQTKRNLLLIFFGTAVVAAIICLAVPVVN